MESDKKRKLPVHKEWSSLLGATLEAWINHLLYVRRVYPRDSFVATRFLGIQCQVNRHPGVVDYIFESLRTAVPALVSGTADEIAVAIFKDECVVLERFVLNFSERIDVSREELPIRELEQGMRNLILRVHSLEGREMGSLQRRCDSLCFKVTLRVSKTASADPSPEVMKALSEGEWFHPDKESCRPSSNDRIRPLHRVSVSGANLEMKLIMEC